jgi:hypothetical protein
MVEFARKMTKLNDCTGDQEMKRNEKRGDGMIRIKQTGSGIRRSRAREIEA